MSNPRDAVLDKILGIPDQAKKYRKGIRIAAQELQAQGLEHKALSVRVKSLTEQLATVIDGALTKAFAASGVPDGLSQQVLDTIIDGVIGVADDDEDNTEGGDMPEDEAVDMAVTDQKQITLLDTLVSSQADLVKDMALLAQGIKALEGVAGLPKLITNLDSRLKDMESQLKMRPRRASESTDTAVDAVDTDLTKAVKDQQARYDGFWQSNIRE